MAKLKLPLEGEEITRELINRQRLPENASDELRAYAKDFEAIYRALPSIATELSDCYKKLAEAYGRNPGAVALFMGGGRVKGKPLDLESDVDLFFRVENAQEAIDVFKFDDTHDPQDELDAVLGAMDIRSHIMNQIIEYADRLCKKHGVRNELDILGYGDEMPAQLEVSNKYVPIGISQ